MPRIDNLIPGSSGQRNSLTHQAIEDYLKTIYMLAEEESPVSTSRIAEARAVQPASATNMIQRLAKLNLVAYKKRSGVTLTPAGEQIALEVLRHHRLIELYLMEALGFEWDEVHEQADILEHVISEKLEERIAAALNHPTLDPHGDPIPAKDGTMVNVESQPLTRVLVGEHFRVARIVDDADSQLLRDLAAIGLVPGAVGKLVAHHAVAGMIQIDLAGAEQRVQRDVAGIILVERLEQ